MELKEYAKDVFDLGFNTALRFKIISIPIVGNYIDVAYTESIQTIRERILKNSIEKLDEKKIDKEYLNSFEFLNLLVLTYKMALDEIGLDKIIFFSKLIKNSLESSEEERKYNFDYIKIVHELSIEYRIIDKEGIMNLKPHLSID